jgi:hypothetical protein
VTTIGDAAFRACSGLVELIIPSGVVTVGERAFANCWALTQLEIPSTVTTIGVYFIYECSALRRLTLPARYQTRGWYSSDQFRNVTSVDQLTLLGSPLSPEVVALRCCLTAGAKVFGSGLVGQKFGRFKIAASKKVQTPTATVRGVTDRDRV